MNAMDIIERETKMNTTKSEISFIGGVEGLENYVLGLKLSALKQNNLLLERQLLLKNRELEKKKAEVERLNGKINSVVKIIRGH